MGRKLSFGVGHPDSLILEHFQIANSGNKTNYLELVDNRCKGSSGRLLEELNLEKRMRKAENDDLIIILALGS